MNFGRIALAAALSVSPAFGGCGTYAHTHRGLFSTEIQPDVEVAAKAPALRLPPSWRRAWIGEITVPTADGSGSTEPEPELGGRLPLDRSVLRVALRDALRACGGFDAVGLLEDEAPGASADGLVIDTHLKLATLSRVDDDGTSASSIALWCCSGPGADWLHDRSYELLLEPTFAVRARRGDARAPEIRAAPGRARDALSLFERRDGTAPVVATFFGWPQFAFDSTPAAVERSLAPAAWRAPARDLIARIARMRLVYRVAEPAIRADPQVSVKLLSPAPDATLAAPVTDVQVRIALRPGSEAALKKVIVGDREVPASGSRFDAPVKAVALTPGRPLRVSVVLEQGPPLPLFELSVSEEIVGDAK